MPETYRARRALRDTGLALGIAPAEVDRIAKSFPHLRACRHPPRAGRAARAARGSPPRRRPVRAAVGARRRARLPAARHGHAPVRGDPQRRDACWTGCRCSPPRGGDYPMVQAAKEEVEELGLIKLDVLGVRMQSAMAHAVTEIERTTGRTASTSTTPARSPLDDVFAFKLIQNAGHDRPVPARVARPAGSALPAAAPRPAGRHRRHQPLPSRPGGRRHARAVHRRPPRRSSPHYPHPDLEPVLADTYGVTIWHEQIIEMLAVMTGCDRAAAEVARRALGDQRAAAEGSRRGSTGPPAARGYTGGRARRGVGDRRGVRRVRLLPGARGRLRRARPAVRVAEGALPGRPARRAAGARPRYVAGPGDRRRRPPPRRARPAGRRQPLPQPRTPSSRCPARGWGVRLALSAGARDQRRRRAPGSRQASRTAPCRTSGRGRGPRCPSPSGWRRSARWTPLHAGEPDPAGPAAAARRAAPAVPQPAAARTGSCPSPRVRSPANARPGCRR